MAFTAVINATRTQATGPMAIWFEGFQSSTHDSYSTAKERFKRLHYRWYCTENNLVFSGPFCCMLFKREDGASQTVYLVITDDEGNIANDSQVITVDDPDSTFPTTSTICVSTSGDFTGAPSGSDNVTTNDFDYIMENKFASGKRVLFRRGETFYSTKIPSGSAHYLNISAETQMGAFGDISDGRRAIISCDNGGKALFSTVSPSTNILCQKMTFFDLEFAYVNTSRVLATNTSTKQWLYYNIKALGFPEITIGHSWNNIKYWVSQQTYFPDVHKEIAYWQCQIDSPIYSTNYVIGIDGGEYICHYGNQYYTTGAENLDKTHIMRVEYGQYYFINNNYIEHIWPGSGSHLIKFYGPSEKDRNMPSRTWEEYSEWNIISENVFISTQDWSIAICEMNDNLNATAWIRRFIIEKNICVMTEGVTPTLPSCGNNKSEGMFFISAQDIVLRNNWIFAENNSQRTKSFWLSQHNKNPLALNTQEIYILNNSIYIDERSTGDKAVIVRVDDNPNGADISGECGNNAIWANNNYAALYQSTGDAAGEMTYYNNHYDGTDPIWNNPYQRNLSIGTMSPLEDQGNNTDLVLDDMRPTAVRVNQANDIGAHEVCDSDIAP